MDGNKIGTNCVEAITSSVELIGDGNRVHGKTDNLVSAMEGVEDVVRARLEASIGVT